MSSTERVIDRMNEPKASRSSERRVSAAWPNMSISSEASAGSCGISRGPVSGRASSRNSHDRHSRLPSSGGLSSPWPAVAHHSACSAAVVLVVFSRRSSRTVEKRKISTARRTGLTRLAASEGLLASCERALDHAQIVDQLVGIGIGRAGAADILPLDAGDGGVELAQHDREKLPVGLAGIARLDLLRLAAALKRPLELGLESPAAREARAR